MVLALRNLFLVMVAIFLGSQQAMCACTDHSRHGTSAAHAAMDVPAASAGHCADTASAPSDMPKAECHPDTPFLANGGLYRGLRRYGRPSLLGRRHPHLVLSIFIREQRLLAPGPSASLVLYARDELFQ